MNTENGTNWGKKPTTPQNKVQNPPQKRPLTREQALRRQREAQRRRERRSVLIARLIFMAMVYLVVCAIMTGVIALMYSGSSADGKRLLVLDAEGETLHSVPASVGYIDGAQYISATGLSALCDFTLAGDSKEVTMYFHNIGQQISFTDRSAVVEINGEQKRLSSKIIFKNDYYIPLELIEDYFCGVTIGQSKSGAITVSLAEEGLSLRTMTQSDTTPA